MSVVVRMEEESAILELTQLVSARVGIPGRSFCLIPDGKILPNARSLSMAGVLRDSHDHTRARLHGGAVSGGRVRVPRGVELSELVT